MIKWSFPSRGNGVTAGFSNSAHATFKNAPLQALAREICQNSLDAVDDETKPVRIEFKNEKVATKDFPGTEELLEIINKCKEYWKDSHNDSLDSFIKMATKILKMDMLFVLRISDFNTIGLQGAFDSEAITPWVGLVKSTGVNVKSNDIAAGSYGIGKAAAFINSDLQTVFYRTKDIEDKTAAQGVATLMAFLDESYGDKDPVRQATGFYGNPDKNQPVEVMTELDKIYKRDLAGTDIFIPGFHWMTDGRNFWVESMINEILENFLMSIYYGKLSVKIEDRLINKDTLAGHIERRKRDAKNAYSFYKILSEEADDVVEENRNFYGLGNIRLRLLYGRDLNKKILVVRNSGMKIAEIRNLPKGISFTGILELQGDNLNKFFRKMENPQHNSWDPQRHDNPAKAKEYKKDLETWVSETIYKKLEEESGEETIVDIGDCFNSSISGEKTEGEKEQKLVDTTKSVEISFQNVRRSSSRVRQVGKGSFDNTNKDKTDGKSSNTSTEDVKTGQESGSSAKASSGSSSSGSTSSGTSSSRTSSRRASEKKATQKTSNEIASVRTRVVTLEEGKNRLFITADKDLSRAEIEVVTVGENGKSLAIQVQGILSSNASLENGKIVLSNLTANQKNVIDFSVKGKQNYAMGVNVYGN